MKIPTAVIAAAASKVSTTLDNSSTAININNNAIPKPQLSRRLQQHLADATVANHDNHANNPTARILTGDVEPSSCDSALLQCLMSTACRSCFETMQANSVDWTNVVPDTPCQDVLGFLVAGGHCHEVRDGALTDQDTFCTTFDSCVVWDEEDATEAAKAAVDGGVGADDQIDCTALTECSWPGMHEHFLGDGVCHDAMPGCYNSKACAYDGGDCCEDTCHYPGAASFYGQCGDEGYPCRDPSSANCQPALAKVSKEFCANEDEEMDLKIFDDDEFAEEETLPICGSSETLYRLVQYDSWGDGWDNTVLSFFENGDEANPKYQGGLTYGAQGTVHLCLAKMEPKCYHVKVENGVWGNEISWELRPLKAGAPVLAAGGSPTDCTVPVGGTLDGCTNTCADVRPDTKIDDPNYLSYKNMEGCIEQKCLIQVGNCAQDTSCIECMAESAPDYCYANDNFNVLIDCSMCSCTENRPSYCDTKSSGAATSSISGSSAATHEGKIKPVPEATTGSATGGSGVCSPEQTIKGTSSLIKFSQCAEVDQMMAMVTDFDNDNFGMLDLFEDCAHTYESEPSHGGKSALDCMKILHNLIMKEDEGYTVQKNAKGEKLPENISKAVSTLAHNLYEDGESFCDCSTNVNKEAPMCSSFINFKTLIYEAVDACKSLDAIDCAAWEEFHTPCKKNLVAMYETVDFSKEEQCKYVEEMCGGAGPFPAFRRLDCGGEIAKSAWDFHTMYSRGCLGVAPPTSSSTNVVPARIHPHAHPAPTIPKSSPSYKTPATENKQYTPYDANGASDEKKPYYSSSDPEEENDTSDTYTEKKKHHFFRNTFIIGILATCGFIFHKKRRENFDYMRFRQLREARNYASGLNAREGTGGGGMGDYSGVSMGDSCSFEPPTLPPMPSAI